MWILDMTMDFARKQLEKYGWSAGKGLGKHENGISEALKPKLKRSVTGVGHDPASEFNEHWWTALYDKAANNVQVEDKKGKTKRIKTKGTDEFVITNSTWKLNKKQKKSNDEEQYSEYFVRTAVLTSGGSKTEKVRDSESDEDEEKKRDVFKMTDEELFSACEGRTAHKGARHGIKALGKLARIAQQETLLLALPKYNGYSHSKKLKSVVEDMNLNSDSEVIELKKKKKKRKRCTSNDLNISAMNISAITDAEKVEAVQEKNNMDETVASDLDNSNISRKSKKNKHKYKDIPNATPEIVVSTPDRKQKRRNVKECDDTYNLQANFIVKSKRRKKNQ